MSFQHSVLFIVGDRDASDDRGRSINYDIAAAARPWRMLVSAGLLVDFATASGGPAAAEPGSGRADDADCDAFFSDRAVTRVIHDTPAIDSLDVTSYDALYLPLAADALRRLLNHRHVAAAVRTASAAGMPVLALGDEEQALLAGDTDLWAGRHHREPTISRRDLGDHERGTSTAGELLLGLLRGAPQNAV